MNDGEQRKNEAHELLEKHRACLILAGRRALLERMLIDEVATMDDVRDLVPLPDGISPTAFGAVPKTLARAKIIEAVGYRQSRRPESHGRPITIWRLIDRPGAIDWLSQNPPPDCSSGPHHQDVQPQHQPQLFDEGADR